MTRILVTNDDGIRSNGLEALALALEALGEVVAVAPMLESSAIGHALTLQRPLRLDRIAPRRFSVDGTPADCINVAVTKVFQNLPDVVVSGINQGSNVGDDVACSGTVAGAMEAAMLGIPSLAISLERSAGEFDFTQAAKVAVDLTARLLAHPLPNRTFLNVNVPHKPAKGMRVTVQGRCKHVAAVAESLDPRGVLRFWIEQAPARWEELERSDHHAMTDGWVSVTPLHTDMTNHDALTLTESLSLE